MPSKKILTPLEPGKVYHIYNRGPNHQKVFYKELDYHLFLDKMALYLLEYCSIYSYVLIPNHYHLLLRVNDNLKIHDLANQIKKLILSYTNKVNWRQKRNGGLFLSNFRRIHVDNEEYLKRLVFYIHFNPYKHEIIEDFRNYKHSSYTALISNHPTKLDRKFILDLFGSKDDFISYHNYMMDEKMIKKFTLEED